MIENKTLYDKKYYPAYTNGPWESDATHVRTAINSVATVNNQRKHIALVNITKNVEYEITQEEHDANAKLIAASPDMLDALRMIDDYFSQPGKDDWIKFSKDVLGPVRQAIRLAIIGR